MQPIPFMDEVLQGLDSVFCYIDDVLIASSSPEDKRHLQDIFERVGKYVSFSQIYLLFCFLTICSPPAPGPRHHLEFVHL